MGFGEPMSRNPWPWVLQRPPNTSLVSRKERGIFVPGRAPGRLAADADRAGFGVGGSGVGIESTIESSGEGR